VRAAIEKTVAKNALRLALNETPRKPVFLVGQIDGQQVSVHGEGGKVVVQLPSGERKEIETRDLGINPRKEASDEGAERRGGGDDDGDDEGGGAVADAGGRGEGPAPQAAGAQASRVPGAQEDAAAGEGALAVGERGGAEEGAHDGDGDPSHVAGQGDA
jgi:hypothetical protein